MIVIMKLIILMMSIRLLYNELNGSGDNYDGVTNERNENGDNNIPFITSIMEKKKEKCWCVAMKVMIKM